MLKIVAFILAALVGASPMTAPETVTIEETLPRVVVDELEDNDMAVLEVSWRGEFHRMMDVSWHEFNYKLDEELEIPVYSRPVVVDYYGEMWPGAEQMGWHMTDTEGNPCAVLPESWFEEDTVSPRSGDVYMLYEHDNRTPEDTEDDILLWVRPVWQW